MIDNGFLKNRTKQSRVRRIFYIISNISFSSIRNEIELEPSELAFSPSLATRSQVNFSAETSEICKQIDETPDVFDQHIELVRLLVIQG